MSSEAVISVNGLTKTYNLFDSPVQRLWHILFGSRVAQVGEFAALRNVSFDIRRGETVGIIGVNGSGKSTLLQIICGVLTETSGDVRVKGKIAALLELGAGFNPEFTGRENVFLTASLYGLSSQQIEQRLPDIEAFAEIGDFIDQPVKTYSSGMFVRLAFSVIVHVDADILVIDEALAVGDVFFTQKCLRFLRKFKENGTVLFVSHDTASVVTLCDRAIWLQQGQVRMSGNPSMVSDQYLQAWYETQGNQVSTQHVDTEEAPALSATVSPALSNTALDGFGAKDMIIESVRMTVDDGAPVYQVAGGERLTLVVSGRALRNIHSPLAGFSLKDRLGQTLFGGNTFKSVSSSAQLMAGETFSVRFTFTLPLLGAGDYMVAVAVGQGTPEAHTMHHWVHEAYPFKSIRLVQSGLMDVALECSEFTAITN